MWALGCGPEPQRLKRLSADSFARGLEELVRNDSYRAHASDIARSIASEDGIGRAIKIITEGQGILAGISS